MLIHDEHADYGSGDDVTIMLTAWLMLLRFIIVFGLGASSGCSRALYVCLFAVSACAFGVKSGAPALRGPCVASSRVLLSVQPGSGTALLGFTRELISSWLAAGRVCFAGPFSAVCHIDTLCCCRLLAGLALLCLPFGPVTLSFA